MLLLVTMMAAEAKPDLIVEDIIPVCIEPGLPGLKVVVKNNSPDAAGGFWTDMYIGWAAAPAPPYPGGDRWTWVPGLAGFATHTWVQEMDNYPNWTGWIDAVADTFNAVWEDNESNNLRSEWLTIPSCM
jgi:hypothetical protein